MQRTNAGHTTKLNDCAQCAPSCSIPSALALAIILQYYLVLTSVFNLRKFRQCFIRHQVLNFLEKKYISAFNWLSSTPDQKDMKVRQKKIVATI